MEDNKWFLGKFRFDCALGNKSNEETLENIIWIPYYEENGKYLTKINSDVLELPLKTSEEYPFNTGLDISTSLEISYYNTDFFRHNIRKYYNINVEIKTIEDVRKNKENEWERLKLADANWLPYSLGNEEYTPSKGEIGYNAFVLNWDYGNKKNESNRKYLWKLMPFYYPQISDKKEQRIKAIMIPIAFCYDIQFSGYVTYLDKWKCTTIPEQDQYCNDIHFYNSNDYYKILGLAHSKIDGIDLTHADVIKWYKTTNIVEIKKILEETDRIKSQKSSYDTYYSIKLISDILNQNESISKIISQIQQTLYFYEYIDKSKIRRLIREWLVKNYSNELNNEQIDLLSSFVVAENDIGIKPLGFYDNDILSFSFNNDVIINRIRVFHNLKEFYNTKNHTFLGVKETSTREVLKYYDKNKFREYIEFLKGMLNTIFSELKIKKMIFFHDSSDTIVIPHADLYLNKSLIEMYNAWVLDKNAAIELVYIGLDHTDNLVVRKGTIHQDGANKTFTFEEKEIKRTKFSKIERKLAKKEYQLGLSKK